MSQCFVLEQLKTHYSQFKNKTAFYFSTSTAELNLGQGFYYYYW